MESFPVVRLAFVLAMRNEACVVFLVFERPFLQPSPLWPYTIGGATRTLEPQGRVRARGVALDRAALLVW